ncbi:MAG: InlB B-repeat-containing protein [Fibrobacteraceae bacterium]|nr:InlB B-repeat-containing protein [Fibrobacteraceae bacterium]
MLKLFTTKNLFFTLALTLMVAGQAMGALADSTIAGSTYKKIGSCQELVEFRNFVSASNDKLTTNAILTANIDMSVCGGTFTPIGKNGSRYMGHFNGNNHVISNLVIATGHEMNNTGLFFGLDNGGLIENLILENVNISATKDNSSWSTTVSVGAVVGWMKSGTIRNCYTSGQINTTGFENRIGGIVGYISSGTIENCLSTVSASASGNNTYVGGIAGHFESGIIRSCVYDNDAGALINSGSGSIGGLVGSKTNNGNIEDCYYKQGVASVAVGSVTGAGTGGTFDTLSATDLNTKEISCDLNHGTLTDGVCSVISPWGNCDNITNFGFSYDEAKNLVYVITFDPNGGTAGAISSKGLRDGEAINGNGISTPSYSGKTFIGWATTNDANAPETLGDADHPKTVYAVWKNNVTITFDGNGGKFADDLLTKDLTFAYNAPISAEGIVAPADYTSGEGENLKRYVFKGWAKTNDASAPEALGNATETATVYAVWEISTDNYYSVTFNALGHGTAPALQRVKENEKASPQNGITADGYTFGGWFTNSVCYGSAFDFANTSITADVELFAKWTPVTYTITYSGVEGADNSMNPVNFTIESTDIVLKTPVKEGYVFKGWKEGAEVVTTILQGSSGNKTFTASWEPKQYKITYLAGINSLNFVEPQYKTHGSPVNLKGAVFTHMQAETPRPDQIGWSLTDGGEKAYELDDLYTENADIVLYPVWSNAVRYSVSYTMHFTDALGNTLKDDTTYAESATSGNTYTLKIAKVNGFQFNQLTSVKTSSNADITPNAQNKFNMPAENVVVEGSYMIETYNITYVGTDMPSGTVTSYNINSAEITLVNPTTKLGYNFVGWYENEHFNGSPVTKIDAGSTGNKTFYAKWESVPRTITVKKEAGSSDSFTIDVSYEDDEATVLKKIDAAVSVNGKDSWKEKANNEPYSYQFKTWQSSSDANPNEIIPIFNVYGSTRITYEKNGSLVDTVLQILLYTDDNPANENDVCNAGLPAKVRDNLSGITPVKVKDSDYTYQYANAFEKDGGFFVPKFTATAREKENISVAYGSVSFNLNVPKDADADELKQLIENHITTNSLGMPSKANADPYSYDYSGWEKNESGVYAPTFDKFVNVDVTHNKNGATPAVTESFKIPVDNGASDAQVADVIKTYLAGLDPAVVPVNAGATTDGYAYTGWRKDEENNKFVPVFEKDVKVVYGDGASDNMNIAIAYGDDDEAIKGKIETALTDKGIDLPKDYEDAPYSYEYVGWKLNDDGDYVVNFIEKVGVEIAYVKTGATDTTIETLYILTVADKEETVTIKDSLSNASIMPLKVDCKSCTYAGEIEKVTDDDNDVSFVPKFTNKVLYGAGSSDFFNVTGILATDDSSTVAKKIQSAYEALDEATKAKIKKDGTEPYHFVLDGWTKDADGDWIPNFREEVTVEITYTKTGETSSTTETLYIATVANQDDTTSIRDSLSKAGITPLKSDCKSCTYASKIEKVTDDDGNVSFIPKFTNKVVYGTGSNDYFEVADILATDDSTTVAGKIQSAYNLLNPKPTISKDDELPFKFRLDGWTKDENGNWVPNFQKFVEIDVVYENSGSTKTKKDTVDVVDERSVASAAEIAKVIQDIEDSLKHAYTDKTVDIIKSGCATCSYTGVDTVQGSNGKITGFETVFTNAIEYDNGVDPKVSFNVTDIRNSDDDDAVIEKIEDTFDNLSPKPKVAKTAEVPYVYEHGGWEKDDADKFVPTFDKYILVDVGDTNKDGTADTACVKIDEGATDNQVIAAIKKHLDDNSITPVKEASSEAFDYEYTDIVKNTDGTFGPTFDKHVLVDVTTVEGRDTLAKTLKISIGDGFDNNQIVDAIETALKNKNPPLVLIPDETSDDSLYTFKSIQIEDGRFVPTFDATVRVDTMQVVVEKDTVKVPIDVVTAKNPEKMNKVIADSLSNRNPPVVIPSEPSWASSDSTYAYEDFKKNEEGYFVPSYIVDVVKDTIHVALDDIDGDGVKDTIDVVVHRTDSDSIISVKIDDALENYDPKIPTPTKADTEDSTYTHSGWEKNEDGNYVPTFTAEEKEKVINVVVGKDTLQVTIDTKDTTSISNQIWNEISKHEDIDLPRKGMSDSTEFEINEWKRDDSTGLYVPVIKEIPRVFKITYIMPETAVMSEKVNSYTFGKKTVLPTASIKGENEWVFMGWFTGDDGMGNRVSALAPETRGSKTFYAYFQRSVKYETKDDEGIIQIVYANNGDFKLENALKSLVSKYYEEDGETYGFDHWEVDKDGVYHAKYKVTESIHSTVVAGFKVMVNGRQLSLQGVRNGSMVTIVDMNGKIVNQGEVFHGGQVFQLPHAGNYIVRVGTQARTIGVR